MQPFDADNRLHRDYRGPKRPTKQVPGINASDINVTGQKTTRDCRLSDKSAPRIRVKAPVAVTGGLVANAPNERVNVRYGRIAKPKRASLAQRKAARRKAIMLELARRGYIVNA